MGYWITSLGLIAFGLIGSLSIGRPFLLVGLALLVLGPLRSRPVLFWPPLVGVILYNLGYWAVAPFYCTVTEGVVGTSSTECSSLIGIRYAGSGIYNPPLEQAHLAGLVLGALGFVLVLASMLWRSKIGRNTIAT